MSLSFSDVLKLVTFVLNALKETYFALNCVNATKILLDL